MSGRLHHSPADIIRHLLVGLNVGTMPSAGENWPIHMAEPDQPDNCITMYDTEGRDFGRIRGGERQVMEGFQVKVRGVDHKTGYDKSNDIAQIMDTGVGNSTLTIDGTTYIVHTISRTSGVLILGKEIALSKRNLFTINAVVSLRIRP